MSEFGEFFFEANIIHECLGYDPQSMDLAFVITGDPEPRLGACCVDSLPHDICYPYTDSAYCVDVMNGEYKGDGVPCIPDPCGCCQGPSRGHLDCDPGTPPTWDPIDIGDLTALIDKLFINITAVMCCCEEFNVDGSGEPPCDDSDVDIGDATLMIDHLFIDLTPIPPCP